VCKPEPAAEEAGRQGEAVPILKAFGDFTKAFFSKKALCQNFVNSDKKEIRFEKNQNLIIPPYLLLLSSMNSKEFFALLISISPCGCTQEFALD